MTNIIPKYPEQLPLNEPYIDELRTFYNKILDNVRNGIGNITIAQRIICEVSGSLKTWQENKEFFWNYFINTDGIGGYFPNPIDIPVDTPLTIYTREHFPDPDYWTKYRRELETYSYIDGIWVNDITKKPLQENKSVVAYGYEPKCKVII